MAVEGYIDIIIDNEAPLPIYPGVSFSQKISFNGASGKNIKVPQFLSWSERSSGNLTMFWKRPPQIKNKKPNSRLRPWSKLTYSSVCDSCGNHAMSRITIWEKKKKTGRKQVLLIGKYQSFFHAPQLLFQIQRQISTRFRSGSCDKNGKNLS